MSELRGAIHAPGALTGTVSGPEGLSGRVGGGAGGGIGYRIGSGLKVVENTLMVDTADAAEAGDLCRRIPGAGQHRGPAGQYLGG